MRTSPLPLLWTLAACGGVSVHVDGGAPPTTVAVLPFAGTCAPELRAEARILVEHRLRQRGLATVRSAVVDQRLGEVGWLTDPARFDERARATQALCAELGVDGIVRGADLDDSRFNVLLLRRHAFGGKLAIERRDGSTWWSGRHTASSTGGLLLQSGQVLSALQAQGDHGTPRETLALLDQFVDETLATLPPFDAPEQDAAAPAIADARAALTRLPDGQQRLTVSVRAPRLADLRFDLEPGVAGVPMGRVGEQFVGAQDLAAGAGLDRVRVRARSALSGAETIVEVRP